MANDEPEPTRALVARVRAGDSRAAELLVRRHLRAAYAVALSVVRDVAEAEDVAQDAFAIALSRLDTCRDPDRFSGWLLRIVRRQSLNAAVRARGRRATLELSAAADVGVPGAAERGDLRARLLAALDRLTPAQREVVLLHDLEGFTHLEIAEALDMSEVSSRQHLFNARRALRALLDGSAPPEALHGP